jgi:hypothetical protein
VIVNEEEWKSGEIEDAIVALSLEQAFGQLRH